MEPSATSTITPGSVFSPQTCPVLTPSLVESISTAYYKSRQNDARKVRKVIWNKLDDLTSVVGVGGVKDDSEHESDGKDIGGNNRRLGRSGSGNTGTGGTESGHGIGSGGQILSGIASGLGLGGSGGAGSIMEGVADLDKFVRIVNKRGRGEKGDVKKERDVTVGASVTALWSGRVNTLIKMRDRQLGGRQEKRLHLRSIGLNDRDNVKGRVWSEGDKESDQERTDGLISTEDESEVPRPWSGRMQKKIETWTG